MTEVVEKTYCALFDRDALAAYLDVSPSHVSRMQASGKLPRAIKIGRLTRWRRGDVEGWIEAGCPPTVKWEAIREMRSIA